MICGTMKQKQNAPLKQTRLYCGVTAFVFYINQMKKAINHTNRNLHVVQGLTHNRDTSTYFRVLLRCNYLCLSVCGVTGFVVMYDYCGETTASRQCLIAPLLFLCINLLLRCKMEREADFIGLQLMAKACFDPHEMPKVCVMYAPGTVGPRK